MKLRVWMNANSLTSHDFSVKIASQLGRNYFSLKTVEGWIHGRTIPRRDVMAAIVAVTNGMVTANDFFEEGQVP
jgi:hypothetical protein